MATPGRVGMNKARHMAGRIAKQKEEQKKKEKEWAKKNKVSKREHEERVKKLKEMGLIK